MFEEIGRATLPGPFLSSAVFATLAGSLGAYFLETRRPAPEGPQDQ